MPHLQVANDVFLHRRCRIAFYGTVYLAAKTGYHRYGDMARSRCHDNLLRDENKNRIMKIVIIDNYDSFTYNLSHLLKELGAEVTVWRNDCFKLPQLRDADKIVLSPGPGIPAEAGLLKDVISTYAGSKPILGVCLGHQAIGEVFGAKLVNLSDVFHGVATEGTQFGNDYIFAGCSRRIVMGRYHSWVVATEGLPSCLETIAVSDEGHIMALRHRQYDIRGIQFHPESVLTPDGRLIMTNWLKGHP